MFRARIYAQGFTLIAMIAGSVYWSGDRDRRKQFEGVVAEKKAREKNEAWIRELEARDLEDREIAAQREELRKRKEEGLARCVIERREERGLGILVAVKDLVGK